MGTISKAIIVVISVLLVSMLSPLFVAICSPPGEMLDVVIIDGQSNGAYSNVGGSVDVSLVNNELSEPSHNIYYFGTASASTSNGMNINSCAIHKIYDNGYIIGGLEAPLAYYLSEKTGHDVLVLNVSVSAQSITNLIPTSSYGQWGQTVIDKALSLVKDDYDEINMIGWLWLQGESDKNMQVSTYESYFMSLKQYFNSVGAHDSYIIPVRESVGGNAHTAQMNLIHDYPTIHLATEIQNDFTIANGMLLDNLHYSQEARILLMEASVSSISVPDSIDSKYYLLMGLIPMLILILPIIIVAVHIGGRIND